MSHCHDFRMSFAFLTFFQKDTLVMDLVKSNG